MSDHKKFIVSHAPFWHNGSGVPERSFNIFFAALPALFVGIYQYGLSALGVAAIAISTAIFWEYVLNKASKKPIAIADGNSAVIGLIFAMMLPANTPWWVVITGTFVAVVIGKEIFGGIGSNPFNPIALSIAILMVSWKSYLDFDAALVNYDLPFASMFPLTMSKAFGPSAVEGFNCMDLLLGQQVGGIGASCGLAIILGGIYLILRGFIRWEIVISFLMGVLVTAFFFNSLNPQQYAGPMFHLLTGYTLIGAFFLATEDSSSPVNFIPLFLYGAIGGIMTILIRNIGAYVDGVIFAILLCNVISPLLDKIRPKALGKVG